MKARAGSGCVPRRWAARFATRSAPRMSGWAEPIITSPQRSALPPLKRKPKRKKAFAARHVACAKPWLASRAVLRRARSRKKGDKSGTENTPLRIPPRLQQAVELALVRRSRLRRDAARRREAAPRVERAPQERGHQLHRYRARRQQARRAYLHSASGHHHRPQGRGNRQAQGTMREED